MKNTKNLQKHLRWVGQQRNLIRQGNKPECTVLRKWGLLSIFISTLWSRHNKEHANSWLKCTFHSTTSCFSDRSIVPVISAVSYITADSRLLVETMMLSFSPVLSLVSDDLGLDRRFSNTWQSRHCRPVSALFFLVQKAAQSV